MEFVTLKQFADSKGISYEAVRKQVVRYADELKGHITVKQRTQYIDDWAVTFLSERRRESPIVMVTEDQRTEIEKLTEQVETLKAQLVAAQNELLSAKDQVITLQGETRQLIETKANYESLLTAHTIQEEKMKGMETDLTRAEIQREADQKRMEELQKERDQAIAEANSYTRSIFGFYRKR